VNRQFQRNRLLAALSAADAERLRPHVTEVHLDRHQVLYEANSEITRAYFPLSGMISLLTVLSSGPSVETASIGREGFVGMPLLASHTHSTGRAVVQVAGRAAMITSNRLQHALRESTSLRDLFGRYSHAFLVQVFQSVACNAVHSAEERLARWLLSAADRLGGGSIALTHEFVAELLGVGRPTVTLVAGALQAARLINYRRGLITIVDRPGLEKVPCECYWIVRRAYEQSLPLTYK
jgi:CRP-like cAMP-binding protein